MSLHAKYLETSRRSKANWAARNRERINARRRERRLKVRAARLADKHCLNCTAKLSERLDWSPGRSYLYCRKCLDENPAEVGRHRTRRYFYRKTGLIPKDKELFMTRKRHHPTKHLPIEETPEAKPKRVEPPKPIYIKRREKVAIVTCSCGNRYLPTRQGQSTCLPCIAYGGDNLSVRSRVMVK
jgi:hypothetical protein